MTRALLTALLLSGCGPTATPCLPAGELRFFMSRGLSCAPLAGALTIADDRKTATLTLEDGFSGRCAVSGSDDRDQPIGVCQLTVNCVQTCAACERWSLSLFHRGGNELWSGGAMSDLPTCNFGTWSATP
jgi:hypothetical protein